MQLHSLSIALGVSGMLLATSVSAQNRPPAARVDPVASAPAPNAPKGIAPPTDYVIGPDDQLSVVFWRDKDMSADVTVRPDGKITLPLLNDIQAAGLSPDQLREKVTDQAKRYVEDPQPTIVVRMINSRKVFITGQVAKPGPYSLMAPTTVLQLISMAGGLTEYAHGKKISIMRTENGRQIAYHFNYNDIAAGKNMRQNIELKPGDTVVVP
jgi:polysaccharide export outer membrane protein